MVDPSPERNGRPEAAQHAGEASPPGNLALSFTLKLDGDDPGRTATATILPELARHLFVRVAALPDGKSPDNLTDDELASFLPPFP